MFARNFYLWLVLVSVMALPTLAAADEGGISFWLTGQFGSLAAVPEKPGWSFADIYYHTSVSADGNVAVAREFSTGAFSRTTKANLNVNLNAHADLDFVSVSYVFTNPVLNGQLAVSLAGAGGYNRTSIDGTLTTSCGHERVALVTVAGDLRMFILRCHSAGTPASTISWFT